MSTDSTQLPQVFDGAVQLGDLLPGHLGRRQESLAGELLPQRLGQVGHLVKGGDAPVEPVEDLLGPEGGLSPLLQPGGQLRGQRDRPVRQQELFAQQIHLSPGEVLDFVPHQTGHPRQPQDGSRGIICMLFQHPAKQGSIGAVERVTLHGASSFCYACVSQK